MSPQQRSLVNLLAFTAVAAGVGLYAYFGVMKGDEKEAAQKESSDKLFSTGVVDPDKKKEDGGGPPPPEFTKVTVRAKGDTTVVEKRPDGTWRMTTPVSAAVDQYVLDSLTNQLKDGKVDVTVEEKPTDADLAKYGLKDPAWTVEATALVEQAPKQVKVQGGVENAFNGSVYLRKGEDPAVYSAAGAMRFNLEKSAYDLRDKQVLSVDEAKIESLDVVRPKGGGYSLARGEGAQAWKMTKPKAQDADGQTVINLLGQLKSERATAFVADSPEARKKDGLESPAVDATFALKGGEKIRIRLARAGGDQSGKAAAGPPAAADKYYALREDHDGAVLAEVNASALGHLDKSGDELRDKSVLHFNRDEVEEVLFKPQGGGAAIRVTRDHPKPGPDGGEPPPSESWAVQAPEMGPAKAWKLSSNLWTLSSLQATAFGEDGPKSWDKYGINDQSRQVVLTGAGGKPIATLAVGSEVKGKANTVYVRGTRNMVLEMDSARLSDFPQKVDDLLDRPPPPPPPPPPAAPDAGAK
ncbi:MAG TPA: DUF4340 domain-containing protein [Myxococcaceae bacterium]